MKKPKNKNKMKEQNKKQNEKQNEETKTIKIFWFIKTYVL